MNNKNTKNLILSMFLGAFMLAGTAFAGPGPGGPGPIQLPPTVATLDTTISTTTTCSFKGNYFSQNAPAEVWFKYSIHLTKLNLSTFTPTVNAGSGPFTITATGLNPGTTYDYVAMMKINGVTYTATDIKTCTTASLPVSTMSVTTNSATNVTETSFDANATVTLQNESAKYLTFIYGTDNIIFDQSIDVKGTLLSTGNFSDTITGLNPGTTYYYKACATRVSTLTMICGSSKSVTTNSINPTKIFTVSTDSANPSERSAKLYGSFNSNQGNVTTYFKWGETSSLGEQTNNDNQNTNSGNMEVTITGLSEDEKYYYQACGFIANKTECGDVESFTTDDSHSGGGGSGYVIRECNDGYDNDHDGYFDYPSDPGCSSKLDDSEAPYNGNVITPTPNPIIKYVYADNGNANQTTQFLDLSITTPNGNVYINDNVQFTISYGNISKYASLKNVTIDVRLPNDLVFLHSQSGIYDSTMNVLTIDLGTLSPLETGNFVFDARVGNISADNNLNVEANGKYMVNNVSKEVRATVMLYSAESDNLDQTASAIFGNGSFLPKTFMGWVVMLLILFGIIYLARKMYKKDGPVHSVAHH